MVRASAGDRLILVNSLPNIWHQAGDGLQYSCHSYPAAHFFQKTHVRRRRLTETGHTSDVGRLVGGLILRCG
jgi:hypothetical protein